VDQPVNDAPPCRTGISSELVVGKLLECVDERSQRVGQLDLSGVLVMQDEEDAGRLPPDRQDELIPPAPPTRTTLSRGSAPAGTLF
jgi:hypothetical protein